MLCRKVSFVNPPRAKRDTIIFLTRACPHTRMQTDGQLRPCTGMHTGCKTRAVCYVRTTVHLVMAERVEAVQYPQVQNLHNKATFGDTSEAGNAFDRKTHACEVGEANLRGAQWSFADAGDELSCHIITKLQPRVDSFQHHWFNGAVAEVRRSARDSLTNMHHCRHTW